MKIGIITPFDNGNYGNRLQNYALQHSLMQHSNKVITIKNKPCVKKITQYILRATPLAECPWLNEIAGKKRKACFLKFNKNHIKITSRCYFQCEEFRGKMEACDLFCVGSDQVWNPCIGKQTTFRYLGFAPYDATFSYAASFGIDKIPEEYVEAVRKGLNHIKFISVREDAGKRIVEELTGRTDVQVLVDPTMLLTTAEWDKIIAPPKAKLPEKYVLTYFLGTVSHSRRDAIYSKAAQMGCQVIEVMDKNSPFYVIGPSEFVYLIKHAALVCTDSFHGSVFSFLYRRPMAIFDRKGSEENMSSRLETLAEKFDLRDCLVREDDLSDICLTPDYSVGYAALDQERRKSKAFLDMVFQEAERAGLCK